jgi:hypothetical protein
MASNPSGITSNTVAYEARQKGSPVQKRGSQGGSLISMVWWIDLISSDMIGYILA